jgi:conjugal transfer pilus assembly protein TraK
MNTSSFILLTLGLWVRMASADEVPSPTVVETPPVPARLLSEARREAEAASTTQQTLRVSPGVNEIIPVAQGHLNRLITPFDSPKVRTVSPATTQIEGHVVYVAPADENPVTLYVTPGDNEELALSLTLAPRRIPPREIRLTLDAEHYRKLGVLQSTSERSSATSGRLSQGYVTDIKQTFRALALMRTPRGYSLRAPLAGETLRCTQPDLTTTIGQTLEGRDLLVLVGTAKNSGLVPLELDERACADQQQETVAVAAWPKVWLEPGEMSELYVAIRRTPEAETTARPSLLKATHP